MFIHPWRLLSQSGGGHSNPKAEDASPLLKQRRPLLQNGGGPGVAKAPEALAPKPRRPLPQSRERPMRSQSGAGQIGPKAAEAVDLECRRSGYSQRSKGPCPSLADLAPPSAGRSLPESGGGPGVANTEEGLSQKQQRPRCTQSGGGPCPKAAEAPVFPNWQGPLPQIGGGVGALQSHRGTRPKPGWPASSSGGEGPSVPKATEAPAPNRGTPWRSHCRGGSSLGVQSCGGAYKEPSYMEICVCCCFYTNAWSPRKLWHPNWIVFIVRELVFGLDAYHEHKRQNLIPIESSKTDSAKKPALRL